MNREGGEAVCPWMTLSCYDSDIKVAGGVSICPVMWGLPNAKDRDRAYKIRLFLTCTQTTLVPINYQRINYSNVRLNLTSQLAPGKKLA